MVEAISPIKQTQHMMIDTLFCLGVPYETGYGITKTGRKTRTLKTKEFTMEFFYLDKLKLNGKVTTLYEAQKHLIRVYHLNNNV